MTFHQLTIRRQTLQAITTVPMESEQLVITSLEYQILQLVQTSLTT